MIILLDFSWWDCIWQSAKEQLRKPSEQFGCHVDKATIQCPTLGSLWDFGKKQLVSKSEWNSELWQLCKATLGPAPLLIFTGRRKDLGIGSEKHLTRWKAHKVPHKTKCFHGKGCAGHWLYLTYLNTGKTCQVSQRDDENGILRLPVWAAPQPSWASCTVYFDSCFSDFALFPGLGCVASVRGTYPWNSPSIRCTVLYVKWAPAQQETWELHP